MATTTRTVTYEEWLEMPVVEDATEEVVNGEIRIMPRPKFKHTLIVQKLGKLLSTQIDENLILVLIAPFGLIIQRFPLTSRVPDLAVFLKKNMVEQDGYIHSAPELIVEVLSPANTRVERAAKLRDYEQIRVPEVWVLSPEARTFEVLELQENQLRTTKILAEGQISPAHFPGVSIDVISIWPD